MTERMSLRRFLRGGYAEISGPTEVLRRTETVFVATPTQGGSEPAGVHGPGPAGSTPAPATTPMTRPDQAFAPGEMQRATDEAYRRLSRKPKA